MNSSGLTFGLLIISLFFILGGSPQLHARGDSGTTEKSEKIKEKVQKLLDQMSVEEKVGQMTQVTLEVVSKNIPGRTHEIDKPKLKRALHQFHVGSILNVGSVPGAATSAFSIEHWHELIKEIQDEALSDRLKVPVIYGIDSIHGAQYTVDATIFPQSISVAASWDPKWSQIQGEVTALETRASGIPWNFFPVLDMGRQPLWPRFYETYGEDVYLAQAMAKANVIGQQGSDLSSHDKVAVCMKHYAGYSNPTSGKDRTPANISERMMREYYLPTFQTAIEAGAQTLMVNSGEVDGVPGHANYHLLTEILRHELNFKGFAVSDWQDIMRLYDTDHLASSPEEAVKMAVMAGVDMSMVPFDFEFAKRLIKLVKNGAVPMSRIDEAVSRILTVKFNLGLFENPYPMKNGKAQLAKPESTIRNLEMAQESVTLLKNESRILPLPKSQKVLVTGPTAQSLSALNGGWTITWQGDQEDLYPKNKKTILRAIQDKIGPSNVLFSQGSLFDKRSSDLTRTMELAKQVDTIVLCLGEKAYAETPGNINDLNLNDAQIELAEKLFETGKKVVLVLIEGRPRIVRKIETGATAILMGYLPGMEGGVAIANILYGDVNPSGKLPFSYPRFPNSLVPYDHKYRESDHDDGYNPQWPFGFGLSFTDFEYSHLRIHSKEIKKGESVKVSVNVRNRGKMAGKEVVQLYLSDLYRSSVTPPVKQLRGFQKIMLGPNESKPVTFEILPQDLSFIDRNNQRIIEPGDFKIAIGNLEQFFKLLP